jgi:hypothetical protein
MKSTFELGYTGVAGLGTRNCGLLFRNATEMKPLLRSK